jgi:hypothetical protein
MTYNVKSKGVSYTAKYWFARGYSDCISNIDNPPSIELQEYFLEMLKVDVIEEYNHGKKIAERDKINRGG